MSCSTRVESAQFEAQSHRRRPTLAGETALSTQVCPTCLLSLQTPKGTNAPRCVSGLTPPIEGQNQNLLPDFPSHSIKLHHHGLWNWPRLGHCTSGAEPQQRYRRCPLHLRHFDTFHGHARKSLAFCRMSDGLAGVLCYQYHAHPNSVGL